MFIGFEYTSTWSTIGPDSAPMAAGTARNWALRQAERTASYAYDNLHHLRGFTRGAPDANPPTQIDTPLADADLARSEIWTGMDRGNRKVHDSTLDPLARNVGAAPNSPPGRKVYEHDTSNRPKRGDSPRTRAARGAAGGISP